MPTVAPQMFTPLQGAGNYFGIEPGDLASATYCVAQNLEGLSIACALPDDPAANSFEINAKSALKFYFNREAAADGMLPMEIAAGSIVCITNRDHIKNFCFIIEADTSFTLQYGQGEGGVPPFFFLAKTSGVTPPPPPGGAALYTINTLWVMQDDGSGNGGHDTGPLAGTRNRMDLPFRTPEAAEAAALAGDQINILSGDYALTASLGKDGVKYTRWGANLSNASGAVFVASGISIEVTGFGTLQCGTSSDYALNANNGGSITASGTIDSDGGGILCETDSEVVFTGDISAIALYGIQCYEGRVTVNGQVYCADLHAVYSSDRAAVVVVNGDVESFSGVGARCADGSMTINGDALSTDDIGASCSDGRQVINGTAHSLNSIGAYCNGATAVQIISEDAISDTNYGADCSSGEQTIGRDAIVTASGSGNAAYCGPTGVQHIMRNAINEGVGAATSTTAAGALQYVHGDARNVSGACCRSTGGYTKIYGDAYSETERAVLAQGGTVEIMGTAISDAYLAVDINANGTCILWCGATTNLAASEAITLSAAGDTLILRGAAYVRNDGSGNAIEGAAGTVTSYGAYGAAPVAGTLTLNGTYTVI